jgi:hypothetical protein
VGLVVKEKDGQGPGAGRLIPLHLGARKAVRRSGQDARRKRDLKRKMVGGVCVGGERAVVLLLNETARLESGGHTEKVIRGSLCSGSLSSSSVVGATQKLRHHHARMRYRLDQYNQFESAER